MWLMIARTGDWIGSAPVAGTRTNGQLTVSGNRITIAMRSANRKAASNIQPVERMIQGGGSCGNISDSTSSEPRSVNRELMEVLGSDSQLLARKIIVQAALCHQLIVSSNLGNTSLFQHHDRVRFANGT